MRCSQEIWIYFRGIVMMEWFIKIPNVILQDKELNHTQMILYGCIESLAKKKWFCWAKNKVFAEYLNVDDRTVQRHLNKLKEKWYIEIKLEDNNRDRIVTLPWQNCRTTPTELSPSIYIWKDNITDNKYSEKMFELFWKQYPHYRQWKKQDSKNFFLKQDPAKVMKQVVIYKRQTLSWIKDKKYVPACQRWIRDFTELSDDVIQQDLKQIVKRHLNTEWDKHERYEKLKQDFPDVNFNEIAKEISREKWLIKMTFT